MEIPTDHQRDALGARGFSLAASADLELTEPESLLARIVHSAGAVVDEARLARAARQVERAPRGSLYALAEAVEALGVVARVCSGDLRTLITSVGHEHPAVVASSDGQVLLITERVGRRVLVESERASEPMLMRERDLSASIAAAIGGFYVWLSISPPPALSSANGTPDGTTPSPARRLSTLVLQERQDVMVTVIYAAGAGLLTLATPLAVQALVNTVAFGTLLQPVLVLSVLLLAGLAFAGVLRALQAWVVEVLQRRVFLRLTRDLSRRLPKVEPAAFDQKHGPELLNRFFDIFTIQKAASSLLIDGLEIALTAGVGMLVLAFYHPLLLAFDALLLALIAVVLFVLGRGATVSAVRESKAKYEVAGWLEEIARHPMAFKMAGGPELARDRSEALSLAYLSERKDHFKVVFRQLAGALSLQAFASAGILGIGGYLVIDRQLTLGQLVAAELIVTMVVASFAKVGKHLESAYDLLAALDKVGQLVDLPQAHTGITASLDEGPSGIALNAAGLSVQAGEGTLVRDLSLAVAPGERIVIIPDSGRAASIAAEALVGLRAPSRGHVEIGGVHTEDLDAKALRRTTTLVRGHEIVSGTIEENVAFGRPEIDRTRAFAALDAVGLLDEISALEEGMRTPLLPDGAPLSRGQVARLTLARALAGRPGLVVVDGALDGLDDTARGAALDALVGDDAAWTTVLISHDPVVMSRADRTFVMASGMLEEVE